MTGRTVLIDYGAGNLRSVENALKMAGEVGVEVGGRPEQILAAERVVLPGVGAFAHCMSALNAIEGMISALEEAIIVRGRPFLGICVGMQLMADAGLEHGRTAGLGWIGGEVAAIEPVGIKVPHMGWNDVSPVEPHPLIEAGEAYFLHSYAFTGMNILAQTDHGGLRTAAIGRDNMIGVQFHPEKSQAYGLAFLERFLAWRP